MNGRHRSNHKRGFSLLEVIIATGILAASGMVIMSMFSTADRHSRRANKRAIAQMLCQTKLEELLINPSQILPIEAEVIRQYPGWVHSVELEPTAIAKFVQLTVSVTHIPGTELGANLELATSLSESSEASTVAFDRLPEEPTFRLVRWLEYEGDLTGFEQGSSSSFRESSEF